MKNRREMTAMQHIAHLEREGYIRVKGNRVIVRIDAYDEWTGEMEQVVRDYTTFLKRHGYEVVENH